MSIFTVVVPVYKNEESLDRLLTEIADIASELSDELRLELELVLVVDGSPDNSYTFLQQRLPSLRFKCILVAHSKNFGSFAAIRTGLAHGSGAHFGVMAADLQEPSHLMTDFARVLSSGTCDVAVGERTARNDKKLSNMSSSIFWSLYRRFIIPDMPNGGVDVFGCTREFRDHLLELEESRSSLVGMIFWLGFRRTFVPYERLPRLEGRSAWTLRKKLDYMTDSIFAFTDYPIKTLMRFGFVMSSFSILVAVIVICARLLGLITVPGYAALMLAVVTYGAMSLFALGLVGEYACRAYENTKHRPYAVVARAQDNRSTLSSELAHVPLLAETAK